MSTEHYTIQCDLCSKVIPDTVYKVANAPYCHSCYVENYTAHVPSVEQCPGCDRQVERHYSQSPYCCSPCQHRNKVRNYREKKKAERTVTPVACEQCEEPFIPKRSDAKFCSAYCRVKANREQKKAVTG